jgi:hypothetical protein
MLRRRDILRNASIAAIVIGLMLPGVCGAKAGEWVTDAKSGCAVWDPNPQLEEAVAWSGSCSNGRAEGSGTVQWLRGKVIIETDDGAWHDGRMTGKGVQSWLTGRYEGELVDGEPNGRGVLTLQRLRYEGEFRDGKPNGSGSVTAGGETLRGTWKDGCLQDGPRKVSVGIPLSACR